MTSRSLSRRSLLVLLSASVAAACSPAQTTQAPPASAPTSAAASVATSAPNSAAVSTPTNAPANAPTVAPAQATAPANAAVVSRTGRVQLPTYVPPISPPPDVPGGTVTPPGYTSYPQKLIRAVPASPFGTEENQLIAYGLEGRDFTRGDSGAPVLTDQGRADWMQRTMNAVVNPSPVYFDPLGTDYVPHVIDIFKQYEAVGVSDPTVGYYSESNGRQGVTANQRFGDGITDIVVSRRPLSDLDSLLNEWRSGGGDQVRKEFEDAMAA